MSKSEQASPSVLVFYHYFYPDDVVSARHLTDLATGLAEYGFTVEAMPSNRSCRTSKRFESTELYRSVVINRIYRPDFTQASTIGRLLNLSWMTIAWSLCAFRRKPDVLIVGTDPILSVLIALPWKLIRPKTKIVHWCFDLYPDAAEASGLFSKGSLLSRMLRKLLNVSYRRCEVVVDIGRCMRARIPDVGVRQVTLTPWALAEPPEPLPISKPERNKVFGKTPLAILYSGNFGEAHSFDNTLALARRLQGDAVIAFSVRGNRVNELRQAIQPGDQNIRFVDFTEEQNLQQRLACADIHLVTLRDGWQGIVVPSKFFGALAIGRPILFDGPNESAIAEWINQLGVGMLVQDFKKGSVLPEPDHCLQMYQEYFSQKTQLKHWCELIDEI